MHYYLDEKDIEILKILAKNSRISYTEIAKYVNLSDVAVIKRVKKLENRIIKRYTIAVDPRELGYKIISVTGIDVDPDKMFFVVEAIKNKEYVKGLWLTTGDHLLLALIWGRNEEEVSYIHKDISSIDGVKRVCPAIILRTIKDVETMIRID